MSFCVEMHKVFFVVWLMYVIFFIHVPPRCHSFYYRLDGIKLEKNSWFVPTKVSCWCKIGGSRKEEGAPKRTNKIRSFGFPWNALQIPCRCYPNAMDHDWMEMHGIKIGHSWFIFSFPSIYVPTVNMQRRGWMIQLEIRFGCHWFFL